MVRVRLTPTARFSAKRQRTVPWVLFNGNDGKSGPKVGFLEMLLLSNIFPEILAWWPQLTNIFGWVQSWIRQRSHCLGQEVQRYINDTVIKLTQKGCNWFGQNDMKLEVLCLGGIYVDSWNHWFSFSNNYGQVWEESPRNLGGRIQPFGINTFWEEHLGNLGVLTPFIGINTCWEWDAAAQELVSESAWADSSRCFQRLVRSLASNVWKVKLELDA